MHGRCEPGEYVVPWDRQDGQGQPAACGVYFVQLRAGGLTDARPLVLGRR